MEVTVQYAGFWRRVAATIIDNLLLAIVLAPLLYLFTSGDYLLAQDVSDPVAFIGRIDWGYLLIDEGIPLVLVIFLWVRFETTPGKRLLNCYVVDAVTFDAISVRQAFLRYIGYIVSILPLFMGFIWIAFDKRKRGFHDIIAGSVVVVRASSPLESDESQKSIEQLMRESS